MLRPGRVLAPLCLAATLLPAVPSGAAPCGAAAAARAGRWFVATPPLLPHSKTHQDLNGDVRHVRAVGIDPADPRVVLVTDGDHVHRSDDGGCRWTLVWRLPETAAADTPTRDLAEITSIDVARDGRHSRVLLAIASVGGMVPASTRTYLVRSGDGRTGWTHVGGPTTLTGTFDPERGRWSPTVHSVGDVAYAAVPGSDGTVAYVRSGNGGKTWAVKTNLVSTEAPTAMTGFAVNPYDPQEVWEWGGTRNHRRGEMTGLRYTIDGGVRWTEVDPWPMETIGKPSWHLADVAWPRRGPARILVLGGTRDPRPSEPPPVLSWSGNGGKDFTKVTPPSRTPVVEGLVTHTRDGDAVVVATTGETTLIACRSAAPRRSDFRTLSPLPVKPPQGGWVRMGRDVARATATRPATVVVPTLRNVQLLAGVR